MIRTHWLMTLVVMLLSTPLLGQARPSSIGQSIPNDAATRVVAYQGIPVSVNLPVNKEMRVHLDESVEVGLPVALTTKLNVVSVQGIVYLKAFQAFPPHRLALKGSPSGRIALLDVSATTDANSVKDLFIRTDGATIAPEVPRALTTTQLMRYIAQLTLAPRRTDSTPVHIKRAVLTVPNDSLYRDFGVASTLIAAWRTNKWLSLAVELRNQSDIAITLSPEDVSGVWHAVGFQHRRLLPTRKRGSQTVMFLVGAHDAIADLQQ